MIIYKSKLLFHFSKELENIARKNDYFNTKNNNNKRKKETKNENKNPSTFVDFLITISSTLLVQETNTNCLFEIIQN